MTEKKYVEVTIRDSEMFIIAAHHMTELAELAQKRDYGPRFLELAERMEEIFTWLNTMVNVRTRQSSDKRDE